MTTVLGGVALDHDPIWIDEFNQEIYPGTSYVALDGTENMYVGFRMGHFSITLEATEKTGWLSRTTVDALIEMARVRDASYTLSRNGADCTVRFRHEVSGGPIQMELLAPTAFPEDDTWYYGKIFLMCTG
ncbi:MAG: hypothetical protein JW885_11565 [Deltaproteobacteria bacterium]|nr:hypothetical protein [Candidatus Zymogenaceae bacterium]